MMLNPCASARQCILPILTNSVPFIFKTFVQSLDFGAEPTNHLCA